MTETTALAGRLRIPLLLFAALAAFALVGCKGATEPPFGSTITINEFSTSMTTTTGTKSETFRLSVADPTGLPMSGIDVNLLGQITCAQGIPCPVTMANASGDTSSNLIGSVTTGDSGYVDFPVTAPTGTLISKIGPPTSVTVGTSFTGGTPLLDGTYTYAVTSVNVLGEAYSGSPISITVTQATTSVDTITVSWAAVTGASSYNVYCQQRGDVHNVTASPFNDYGAIGASAAFPSSAFDYTGGSSNVVTGTIQASSAAAIASTNVNF